MADLTPQGHALGVVFLPPDPRNYAAPFVPLAAPPGNIDLRSEMLPIRNQLNLSSCTGEAGSGCLEMMRGDGIPRSPLYLYYRDRQEDGTLATQDTGASMLALCKALAQWGCCPEADAPYDVTRYSAAPTSHMDAAASLARVQAYYQIKATGTGLLQGLWAALVAHTPVLIALQVYPSFESAGADGKVPMPRNGEQVLGGHAIVAVANYVDASAPGGGYIGCRNSWSESWGDGGVAWLPYNYFASGIVQEGWTLAVAPVTPPEPEPDMLDPAIYDELQNALVEASAITGNLDTARYQLRDSDPNGAWTYVGEGSRLQGSQAQRIRRVLELLPPKATRGR